MIDLKEKTDDIKELEIPEIKNENNEENIDNQQIVVTEKKSKVDYNIKFNNSNYFINFFDNICINKYWEQKNYKRNIN